MRSKVAFIYLTDTQIIGCVVKRTCGEALKILAKVQRDYSGIFDGNLSDRNDFRLTLTAVAQELVGKVTNIPETLFIGVPNVFCQAQTVQSELSFARPTKITSKHVKCLWNDAEFDDAGREIFSRKSLFFKVAEFDDVMLDVTGMVSTNVQMVASALSVSNEFRPIIDQDVLKRLGFAEIEFVALAECELFMIPEKHRDAGCTLVRSDFFSTSVVSIIGDGITHITHFDLGAGHLVNEIAEGFSLPYDVAQEFLQQCTPTFSANLDEAYTCQGHSIPAPMFNEFITRRLQDYAERLNTVELARVVYLTGGHLDQVYGLKNMLANICDRTMYFCRDILNDQIKYPRNTLNAIARYLLDNK